MVGSFYLVLSLADFKATWVVVVADSLKLTRNYLFYHLGPGPQTLKKFYCALLRPEVVGLEKHALECWGPARTFQALLFSSMRATSFSVLVGAHSIRFASSPIFPSSSHQHGYGYPTIESSGGMLRLNKCLTSMDLRRAIGLHQPSPKPW